MADNSDKTFSPATRPMINGGFPKPPFWLTSVVVIGLCASLLLVATLIRSRYSHSREPRVHFIQDMDNQVKVKTQHASEVFDDGHASRPRIAGTVARQTYVADEVYANGYTQTWDAAAKKFNVTFANDFPGEVKIDENLLKFGQKKFNTYCMPCHGYDGLGNGPVHYRSAELAAHGVAGMDGWVQPSNLTDAIRQGRPNGHIFNTISNGIRNMGGYAPSIPSPHDRWAIVAYVRALQASGVGRMETQPTTAPSVSPVTMK